MNKYRLLIIGLASLLYTTSCSNNDEVVGDEDSGLTRVTLGVDFNSEETAPTRVSSVVDGRRYHLFWENNDQVSVFAKGHTDPYIFHSPVIDEVDDNKAKFTGEIDPNAVEYHAMYPVQANAKLNSDGSGICVNIPSVQYGEVNTFDKSAVLLLGKLVTQQHQLSYSVSLLHACTFLEAEIGNNVCSIEVQAATNENWKVAGKVDIKRSSSGGVELDFLTNQQEYLADQSATVTLLPGNDSKIVKDSKVMFKPGKYLIALASSSTFPGITVTATYSDGQTSTKSTTDILNLSAGYVSEIGKFTKGDPVLPTVTLGTEFNRDPAPPTAPTRVSSVVDGRRYHLFWENNDQVSVFAKGHTDPYIFHSPVIDEVDDNKAKFTGEIDPNAVEYHAMYPVQTNAKLNSDGSGICVNIPSVQYGEMNSFDKSAVLLLGKLVTQQHQLSYSVSLLHACTFLEAEIGDNVCSIEVQAATNENWKVAGKVDIKRSSSGGVELDFLTNQQEYLADQSATVTLLPGNDSKIVKDSKVMFKPGKYLIALASSSTFPGITVTATYSDGQTSTKSTTDILNLSAGYVSEIGKFSK